jgi:molybdate transport system regulatory protein
MKVTGKVWLEVDGEHVFGPGRLALLRAIDREGSIQAAADRMDISYRHAWSMLKASGERAGRPLVETRRGGKSGGGARLTEYGRSLCEAFAKVERRFHEMLGELQNEVDDLDT